MTKVEVDEEGLDRAEILFRYNTVSIVERGTENKLVITRTLVEPKYAFELDAVESARNLLMMKMVEGAQFGDTSSYDHVLEVYNKLADYNVRTVENYIGWYYSNFDCLSDDIIYGDVTVHEDSVYSIDARATLSDIRDSLANSRRHKFDYRLISHNFCDIDLRIEVARDYYEKIKSRIYGRILAK